MKADRLSGRAVFLCASALALTLLTPKGLFAQCGDADGGGSVNIGDVIYMMNYLYAGGPAPPDIGIADMDDYENLTLIDASILLASSITCHGNFPCPPTDPPYAPSLDSSYVLYYLDSIPAHTTKTQIPLALYSPNGTGGMSLPFKIRIDGQIPTIDSIEILKESLLFNAEIDWNSINADSGEIIIGNLNLYDLIAYERFANIHITVPLSPTKKQVTLEWITASPEQAPTTESSIIPMIVFGCSPYAIEPILMTTCCAVAGDANYDGAVTISDATYHIRFIFSGGPIYQCIDAADANGDNDVNIADATYIVRYVFQGGDAPVCGTTGS